MTDKFEKAMDAAIEVIAASVAVVTRAEPAPPMHEEYVLVPVKELEALKDALKKARGTQ